MLTQLANGTRISEAVRAIKPIDVKELKREIRVKVSKRKRDIKRLVVIPKEVKKEDIRRIKWYIDSVNEETLIKRIKVWTRKYFGINTHALRYAFISEMSRRGYSAQLIAKITGHANLNYILYYTQQKTAEDILRSFVLNKK